MTPNAPDASGDIARRTDAYFTRTREVVEHFGDVAVTYALFLRRPVIAAPRAMLDWLDEVAAVRHTALTATLLHPEGAWVGAGEPIVTVHGSMAALAEAETLMLQKLGAACVAAHHAYQMCLALPAATFIAMDARHCAGAEMQALMAYAAAVGSKAAQKEGARGFIGSSSALGAPFFGTSEGLGTMPHALVGYAGSTLRAAEMFVEACPGRDLTVLTDYFGREVTDLLAVCHRFPGLAAEGRLAVRLDTHGGRYLEGLDPAASYAVLERRAPGAIRRYRNDTELRDLVGTGVSAAAVWRGARGARRGRVPPGPHRRLLRVRRPQVPGHGRHRRPHRRRRHRVVHPGRLARDLRHRRHHRLRRHPAREAGARVPAAPTPGRTG